MIILSFLSSSLFAASLLAQAFSPVTPSPEPSPAAAVNAGADAKVVHMQVPVHLTAMLSSHDAQTGQKFSFVVADDVVSAGVVVIPKCTAGTGTVLLAGKHGINGHEGDLHLRFDSLTETDGTVIGLDPTEQDFEGTNRKALSFLTTRWINGDDVEIKTDKVLTVSVMGPTPHAPSAAPSCPLPSSAPAAP